MSYLGSLNDPKRPISSDASLSGACGASSKRRRWWRWCPAEATRGRGHIVCCRVSARRGKPRRSWCGRGGGGLAAAGLEGGGTGTRAGRTKKRRARASAAQRVMPGARGPASSPMAAHPAPAALWEWSRAAGSACHDSADGDEAGTWRRGASPLPPQAPPPPSVRSPRAQPRRGRGGLGGAALPLWPPGSRASSCGRRRPRHPRSRAHVGRGGDAAPGLQRRRPAGGGNGAPRRGLAWWHHDRAAATRARGHGCGGFGGGRGLRPGLSAQRPPAGPPASPRGPRVHRAGASPLPDTRGFHLSSLPGPNCWGARRQGAPRSQGENREALAGACRRCYPHLPPPRAPPRGWGFGGCSRVSYCLRGGSSHAEAWTPGRAFPGIWGFPGTGGPPSPSPSKVGALPSGTLRSADVNCYTPNEVLFLSREMGTVDRSASMRLPSNLDSFRAFEERGNFRFRELADKGSWRLACKYFEEKYFRECEGIMICHAQNAHIPSCPLLFLHNQQKSILLMARRFYSGLWCSANAEGVAGALQCAFLRTATATWPGSRCGCSLRHLLALAGRVLYLVMLLPRQCRHSLAAAAGVGVGGRGGEAAVFCLFCFIYSHKALQL